MPEFDLENFAHRLIAECLFYDGEYGLVGSLSLIDIEAKKEMFVASFMPDDGTFLIEEATGWEPELVLDEETDVAYRLAIESREYGTYEIPEVAAGALMAVAEKRDLLPSLTVLFEDEEL